MISKEYLDNFIYDTNNDHNTELREMENKYLAELQDAERNAVNRISAMEEKHREDLQAVERKLTNRNAGTNGRIEALKAKNEALRVENEAFRAENEALKVKVDKYESAARTSFSLFSEAMEL